MKKSLVLLAAMAAVSSMSVNAASIGLFEWGVNVDGTTACESAVGDINCSTNVLPSAVDASAFNFNTGLGMISYTITGAGNHYTSLYVDHEIDVGPFEEIFDESGSSTGSSASGQTWEIGRASCRERVSSPA